MKFLTKAIARMNKIAPERLLLLGGGLLLLGLGMWIYLIWPRPLQVITFAVGRGDACVIISPTGHALLIDGGSKDLPDVGAKTLVPNIMLLGVKEIDAILLSDANPEQVNGLPAIMESLPVKMILDAGKPSDDAEYQQIFAIAAIKGIPHQRVCAGDRIHLDAGVTLAVLAPDGSPHIDASAATGTSTVVSLLQYRQARMLFTGALAADGEQTLLAQHLDLHADVLKVAHYGSNYGTTDALLDAVRPTLGLISCPAHNAQYPHTATLARLRAHHVNICRTDVCGMIRLSSDGEGWKVDSTL